MDPRELNEGSKPDVVFLVGGRGTRLQGVVDDRPKPMADVSGRPFLEWLVLLYKTRGILRFVFCTGYMGEYIKSHFGDGRKWGIEIIYSPESVPLGTGGAIRNALDLVHSDPFLVVNGDTYCPINVDSLVDFHLQHQAKATTVVARMDDCRRYGEVKIAEDGSVEAFSYGGSAEAHAGMISSGIYLLHKDVFSAFSAGVNLSIEKDIFPSLLGGGLFAYTSSGSFLDIGTPESYAMASRYLQDDLTRLENPK